VTLHAAVDLGATTGRVVVGDVGPDHLVLREIRRFPNGPVRTDDGLHWDATRLYAEAVTGLRAAGRVDTVGIDSWAIDYGLVLQDGTLRNEPFSYRDSRTDAAVLGLSRRELFDVCGLQHLPFTTVYQLATEQCLEEIEAVLLIPDLLTYWLTRGETGTELTNASTTGLLDVRTRTWSEQVLKAVQLAPGQAGRLVLPGDHRGRVRDIDGVTPEVIAVGSHDTASAFVGAPLTAGSVCISLGTWGLVGLELAEPVLTEAAYAANFTNELGVDGTVRFLRNVSGLWVLQQCLADWGRTDLVELLAAAAGHPAAPLIDIDDPSLVAPGDMPGRVAALGGPTEPVAVVRCLVDSLVAALARTVTEAGALAGQGIEAVHVVGGGSQNQLVCAGLARALGVPVLAGPAEATALGNVLVQARAHGTLSGSLEDLRDLVRRTQVMQRFEP
jgi:rhamnulokinase